jgi:hypothetical protein
VIFLPENRKQLFSDWTVYELHKRRHEQMLLEVENIDADEFLVYDPVTLTEHLFEKYKFVVPQLREDELWRDQEQEVDIKPRNEMPLTEVLKGFRYTFTFLSTATLLCSGSPPVFTAQLVHLPFTG